MLVTRCSCCSETVSEDDGEKRVRRVVKDCKRCAELKRQRQKIDPPLTGKQKKRLKKKKEAKAKKKAKKETARKKFLKNRYTKFDEFYESRAWLKIRHQVLKEYGRVCSLCRTETGEMHVDHIKPRSKYPDLELEYNNLQVLCKACNLGKGNGDETDWREK